MAAGRRAANDRRILPMGMLIDGFKALLRLAVFLAAVLAVYVGVQALRLHVLPLVRAGADTMANLREQAAEAAREIDGFAVALPDLEREVQALETSWPPWYEPVARWQHGWKLDMARKALAAQDRLRAEALAKRAVLQQRIAELGQTWPQRAREFLLRHGPPGVAVALGVLVLPLVLRTVRYFAIAPLVSLAAPIRLAPPGSGTLHCDAAVRRLEVHLGPGERMLIRSSWLKEYDAAAASKRTQLLWRWDAPLVSYAARLVELTRVEAGPTGARVSLWGGTDPDCHIASLSLAEHPGLVFHPRNLVALVERPGELRLLRRWRLGSLQAWCTLQLRFILVEGSGTVVLWSPGGIEPARPAGDRRGVSQESVAGFDSRLAYSVRRNETFWPYLRGREPLFDDVFQGDCCYLVSVASAAGTGRTGAQRYWAAFWEVVGKILGF
jgi:hypothetical protein